ncbi:hypothetical protein PIB30_034911 [Stylosanthes scabra]|uniref:Uncharacterized protein n=1 Tax=Stylosanthes scabra TaxID=79078 RepID=A0ABU6TEX9_9FABA|nr:hypothetical protein [Stylosanthes scabra]
MENVPKQQRGKLQKSQREDKKEVEEKKLRRWLLVGFCVRYVTEEKKEVAPFKFWRVGRFGLRDQRRGKDKATRSKSASSCQVQQRDQEKRLEIGGKDAAQGKIGANWKVPYWVVEALGKGAYKLKTIEGGQVPRT